MKWGFANTAAIVRSLQKDLYYRQQLQSDLKLVLLDHLSNSQIISRLLRLFRCWRVLEI